MNLLHRYYTDNKNQFINTMVLNMWLLYCSCGSVTATASPPQLQCVSKSQKKHRNVTVFQPQRTAAIAT